MTRLFNYFALVVMGALISGCAEEVEDAQPSVGGTVTMKTTVSLSENASTRALTEAGVKTFAAGDQIAVVYEQASGTAKAVSVELASDDITESGKKAAFTVTLSSPKANGKVRYIYPASRAATYIATDVAPDNAATINYAALNTQDGTFASLASNLDLATFDGNMTAQGNLPKTASLINPLTIGKFTIQNSDGTSDLTSSITGLSINDGTNTYAVNRTADEGPIYVAMKPIASSQTIVFNATDNTFYYTKSVSGQTLAANNIYDIKVKTIRGVDLSALTTDYIAQNGDVLMGTLDATHYPVKISIAAGATVTLNGVNISGTPGDDDAHKHAGITCLGDATIILADGTTNIVKGFHENYSGIQPAHNTSGDEYTLTIQGTGTLNASTNGDSAGSGAGIGSSISDICGNITINGGTVTATGGHSSAGIGCGKFGKCGTITISGGIVIANGGAYAAGIGSGSNGSFSSIDITDGITSVIATKGDANATAPIGKGHADENTTCTVTFGTTTVYNGSAWTPSTMVAGTYGGLNLAISTTTNANDTWKLGRSAASAVAGDLGKVIGADGNIYANATQASALGTTAVAMIAYVDDANAESSPYTHGLALALNNAGDEAYKLGAMHHLNFCTDGNFGSESGLQYNSNYNNDNHPAFKQAIANNGTPSPTGCSAWFLPTGYQWNQMINACKNVLGTNNNYEDLRDGFSGVGGTNMGRTVYWSSTNKDNQRSWNIDFDDGIWSVAFSTDEFYVRSALAF